MTEADWIEKALRVLARHHGVSFVFVQFPEPVAGRELVPVRLLIPRVCEPRLIGYGATLGEALERSISQLTDAELIAAGA